jgi:hypothetical protein
MELFILGRDALLDLPGLLACASLYGEFVEHLSTHAQDKA